jgi:hypothetical protein
MLVGAPVALLPWLPAGRVVFAVGLVIVLRNSFTARRHFNPASARPWVRCFSRRHVGAAASVRSPLAWR